MVKLSNKSQLTNLYNRQEVSKPIRVESNLSNIKVLDEIHRECNKSLHGGWYVRTHNVYKANNYDIVKTSMSNYKLQCKYGTSNFKKIEEIEKAKQITKDYDSYSIMELQNMITVDNEPYILKAIEKKIDEQKQIVREHEQEKKKELEHVATKKARDRVKVTMKLKGIYKPCSFGVNFGRVLVG